MLAFKQSIHWVISLVLQAVTSILATCSCFIPISCTISSLAIKSYLTYSSLLPCESLLILLHKVSLLCRITSWNIQDILKLAKIKGNENVSCTFRHVEIVLNVLGQEVGHRKILLSLKQSQFYPQQILLRFFKCVAGELLTNFEQKGPVGKLCWLNYGRSYFLVSQTLGKRRHVERSCLNAGS